MEKAMRDVTPDEFRRVKHFINKIVTENGEWAGAPIPVHGLPLVIEKRYPYQGLNGMYFGRDETDKGIPKEELSNIDVRNVWFSYRCGSIIHLYEEDGKVKVLLTPMFGANKLDLWINTLGASDAWSAKAELTAVNKLSELLSERAFRQYVLTGTFLETSKRSGVTYLFRKLRPTVAIKNDDRGPRVLTSLCLHPIGYYKNSWAGVMTPTDDVTCHLLMMRGDERKFWSKANHHPSWLPEAGI
jgi:hypothetical protein